MDCGLLLTAVGGGRGAELGGLGGVRQAGGADDQRHAVAMVSALEGWAEPVGRERGESSKCDLSSHDVGAGT